ncbi:MAG TPA: PKD domain-containing protein [Cyclobacteriaceae bacterium]|nr:PKD domain-containing protein [Cyclobacteriaceae bacterium]
MNIFSNYSISTLKALCVVIIVGFMNTVVAQNLVPDNVEKAALIALQASTDSAHWAISRKWKQSSIDNYPLSSLSGVTIQNGDIVSMDLSSSILNGSLPSELNNLTELQYLSFSGNNITGTLPSLGNLLKLKTLNLNSCDFTGSFPAWVCGLTQLTYLNLSSNPNTASKLTGPIPNQISQLSSLSSLYLNYNDFSSTGAIPTSFSSLDLLTTLEMQSCGLTPSSVTTGFSDLAALQTLSLTGNSSFIMPNGSFPDVLYNLGALRNLYLSSINFQSLPAQFAQLSNLNYLNLTSNNYSNVNRLFTIFETLRQCNSLETLILISCLIEAMPSNTPQLSTVKELYLNGNTNLEPDQCQSLGSMPSLQELFVRSCNLSDLPDSIKFSTTLRSLYASGNKLNPIPEVVKEIPDLTYLDLNNNGIESLPSWFGTDHMNTLRTLFLNNNKIDLPLPSSFANLTNLTTLDMGTNMMKGALPSYFSSFTNISYLDLRFNEIDSLADFSNWHSLHSIYLQHNKLKGTIPTYLTNVTSSKFYVDLSYNKYNNVTAESSLSTASSVDLSHNALNFTDLLRLRPSNNSFTYNVQDSIDYVRETIVPSSGSLTLLAYVDTLTNPASQFQWYKYVDGVHDSLLFTTPATNAYRYHTSVTLADQESKFYYKITNSLLPQLTLVSRPTTIIISCGIQATTVSFSSKKYLCAVNFNPTSVYPGGCNTKAYTWNFGDGLTSTEKSPLHAYGSAGTYNVSLKVRYSCGVCLSDTIIFKQVTFTPSADNELLMDSLITVPSDTKQQVISVSASTFSDSWPLQYLITNTNQDGYLTGASGVWRNEGSFVYDVPRSSSTDADISKDGTFTLENFNWAYSDVEAIPHWIKAGTMTEYSPFSYELENKDVLGISSAALYDYGGHLPSANGTNMRNNEMAFTSFEYLDQQKVSGNWILGTQTLPAYTSLKVISGSTYMAIVDANIDALDGVDNVDVSARGLLHSLFYYFNRTKYVTNDPIVCKRAYPHDPKKSIIVLRKPPFSGLWFGRIKIKNTVTPQVTATIDTTFAHSGNSSMKITADKTFPQNLLKLDSGKAYFINLWASVNNQFLATPTLGGNIGVDIILKSKNGTVLSTTSFDPSGNIIEGWQQIRGSFVCPASNVQVEVKFRSATSGTVWYDDLRLHPLNGNMKSYVYNMNDYRLRAILDEENFASFFYYDQEGSLRSTKKETEDGIKTISENINYMAPTN